VVEREHLAGYRLGAARRNRFAPAPWVGAPHTGAPDSGQKTCADWPGVVLWVTVPIGHWVSPASVARAAVESLSCHCRIAVRPLAAELAAGLELRQHVIVCRVEGLCG
jgi:hypothetical protein